MAGIARDCRCHANTARARAHTGINSTQCLQAPGKRVPRHARSMNLGNAVGIRLETTSVASRWRGSLGRYLRPWN
eukprot:6194376-Pleurochrysis_carterae.AAC.1